MTTINQTLKTSDYHVLGHWQMWTNKVLNRLGELQVGPRTHIPVQFTPVEYRSANGYEWECQHASTYPDTIDWYIQPDDSVEYPVERCDSCDAYYDPRTEEWYE